MSRSKIIDANLWGIPTGDMEELMCKSYGVGFYSDCEHLSTETFESDCHRIWRRMLALCHCVTPSIEKQRHNREYTMCREWNDFAIFKKFYDEHIYTLDGENIVFTCRCVKKNNTHFCPQLCAFVPMKIVGLLTGNVNTRSLIYPGVRRIGIKYCSTMKIAPELNYGSDTYCIGTFDTAEEAFNNYKIIKELYIRGVAYHYKDVLPANVYNAMLDWHIEKDDNEVKYENRNTRQDVFRLQA